MGWGYKIPTFNTWGRLWKVVASGPDQDTDVSFMSPLYFRCQLQEWQASIATIAVRKHSNFHDRLQTPFQLGDVVQLAGWEGEWARVWHVWDVGTGFPNEYRKVELLRPVDVSWDQERALAFPSTSVTLEPPELFTELGTRDPADFWENPQVLTHPDW